MRYSIDWQKPREHVLLLFTLRDVRRCVGSPLFLQTSDEFKKPLSYCSERKRERERKKKKKKEDLIAPCNVREAVNSFSRAGLNWAIRCSYRSEHSANRPTASWQNVLRVGLREREMERERERERERESEGERERGTGERKGGIVGGGGDALRRLCLGVVYCYCASVIAGGQACQDGAAFPQRPQPLRWNAQEEIQPPRQGAMDGRTPLAFHCGIFKSGRFKKTARVSDE